MRMLTVIVFLALAGGGGWYYFGGTHTEEPKPTDPLSAVEPTPPVIGPVEPPAEARALLAEADGLWAAAGANAARSADAPRIALAYSRALRALDGVAGQQPRIEALVRDRLTPLGQSLFFSRASFASETTGTFQTYVAVSGDSPDAISRRFGMSRELLNRLRGVPVQHANLNIGDTLTVLRVKEQTDDDRTGYRIVIDKSEFRLDLYITGIFAKRYRITHGATTTPTPTGTTFVTAREWHPQWTHPDGRVLMYGDPDNILGPIWMAFDSAGIGKKGIGIHGYTGNGEIGVLASNGCIRLENGEAEELYQMVPSPQRAPTAVVIKD